MTDKLIKAINRSIERHELKKVDADNLRKWAHDTEIAYACLTAVGDGLLEIPGFKGGSPLFIKAGSNHIV